MVESASYLLAVSQSDLVCPITNVIEQLKLDSNWVSFLYKKI